MNCWFALPTWIVTGMLRWVYPPGHPLRDRDFTLQYWYEHETVLCRTFDLLLWTNGSFLVYGLVLGFWKGPQ